MAIALFSEITFQLSSSILCSTLYYLTKLYSIYSMVDTGMGDSLLQEIFHIPLLSLKLIHTGKLQVFDLTLSWSQMVEGIFMYSNDGWCVFSFGNNILSRGWKYGFCTCFWKSILTLTLRDVDCIHVFMPFCMFNCILFIFMKLLCWNLFDIVQLS